MKKIYLTTASIFLLQFAFAQTYTGGGGLIADYAVSTFTLNVSGLSPANIDSTTFGLETVCVNLTHTWDSDLEIRLISPDGTSALLVSGQGGSGDDYTNTCFNQYASAAITTGAPPFTGTFRPMGQLGVINNNQVGNGTWTLKITDMAAQDQGNLISWSVTFGNNPATATPFTDSNLPLVIINTNNQTIVDEPKIMADMGIIYNGVGNRNHLSDPYNNYNGKIGIEIRGNYSAGLPQKPYGFETWDVNGNSINASILGMPAESDWCLIAMYNDKSFMRNLLANYLFGNMGHYASRGQLVEVMLDGEYQGVYLLCESIKRDANRVDIAKLDVNETTWPDVSGGYILKTDYWDNSNSWQSSYSPVDHPGLDVHIVYDYPKPTTIVPQQQAYIQNFIYDYETALYGPNFTDTANGYRKYISVQSFYDYFIVNELSRNTDGFKKSVYFYKEKDHANGTIGKMKMGPVWDFDWAWKDMWGGDFQNTDGSGWAYHINDWGPDVNSTGWYVRLLQDSAFADELNCRWQDLRRNLLDTTVLFHWIDSVAAYANESQFRHHQYWGNMGLPTGTPEVEPPSQSYAEEVSKFKDWIRRRILWLDGHMPGNPSHCNLTGIAAVNNAAPGITTYPNPFSATINLSICLAKPTSVSMELTNALGQTVDRQTAQHNGGGTQILAYTPPADLPAGVYLLQIRAGNFSWTKQVVRGS